MSASLSPMLPDDACAMTSSCQDAAGDVRLAGALEASSEVVPDVSSSNQVVMPSTTIAPAAASVADQMPQTILPRSKKALRAIRIVRDALSHAYRGTALTKGQAAFVESLSEFLADEKAGIFMLRGYAGTGKTFMMKGVCAYLNKVSREVILMAPTGRAAKVLAERTGMPAGTIHSHIYGDQHEDELNEDLFALVSELDDNNDATDAVYIIDEASMVSDRESGNEYLRFGSGQLLQDIFLFAASGDDRARRKVIFVGDPAQLPPVGMIDSPALSENYLRGQFGLTATEATLTEIVRQNEESGILKLAFALRAAWKAKTFQMPALPESPDVTTFDGWCMAEACWEAMGGRLTKHAVMIAHSNKRVQRLNFRFRELYLPGEENLAVGDKLMVTLNTRVDDEFVANGDFCRVERVGAVEERKLKVRPRFQMKFRMAKPEFTLVFQDVDLLFKKTNNETFTATTKILVNDLNTEGPPASSLLNALLMIDFSLRHREIKRKSAEWREALENDEYVHALHVRYGYAVTCHKAQGGEWEDVFVDCFYGGDDEAGHFRWLYTAVTRAKKRLHLANYGKTSKNVKAEKRPHPSYPHGERTVLADDDLLLEGLFDPAALPADPYAALDEDEAESATFGAYEDDMAAMMDADATEKTGR